VGKGEEVSIECASFSPDGRRILTVGGPRMGRERVLTLWDAATGRQLRTLSTDPERVGGCVLWGPDGRRALTWGGAHPVVWDVDPGQSTATLDGASSLPASRYPHTQEALRFSLFSPGGRLLAASEGNALRLIDTPTGKTVTVGKGHGGSIATAAFSRDGRRGVTPSQGGTARGWGAAPRAGGAPPPRPPA